VDAPSLGELRINSKFIVQNWKKEEGIEKQLP
jgi:hypothetical protein